MWTIGQQRVFDLAEANHVLSLIKKITAESAHKVNEYQEDMERFLLADPRRENLQYLYRETIEQWKQKMENLGLFVAGLWQVKFDVGDGFLCWEHPHTKIGHYFDKGSAWEDRIRLSSAIKQFEPNWA